MCVFPAHAGVFPVAAIPRSPIFRLPRARGGVSYQEEKVSAEEKSSPRTRGCFSCLSSLLGLNGVFPAHAGVFLEHGHLEFDAESLPRARGGVSFTHFIDSVFFWSSPRTRGCFSGRLRGCWDYEVFPAHAGVFLFLKMRLSIQLCLPRARGGVSVVMTENIEQVASSPRTRGCFL